MLTLLKNGQTLKDQVASLRYKCEFEFEVVCQNIENLQRINGNSDSSVGWICLYLKLASNTHLITHPTDVYWLIKYFSLIDYFVYLRIEKQLVLSERIKLAARRIPNW